jgi:ribosome-binding ATPase YchF (GTP1/OBG family)
VSSFAALREGQFVSVFLEERFPTILVLNKIDHSDADKNILRITQKYKNVHSLSIYLSSACFSGGNVRLIYGTNDFLKVVLTSALAECFLRKLAKQVPFIPRQLKHIERDGFLSSLFSLLDAEAYEGFVRYEEGADHVETADDDPTLKPLDPKTKEKVDKIQVSLDSIK